MGGCPGCGEPYPASARFCPSCGLSLIGGCAACGIALPSDARFCPNCGAPVSAERAATVEMIKLVTVLFADVVGSTAQAERMAPEDHRALMAEFFEAMIEEIEAEGGTIERLIGDAVMADFGVPVAREDDALRGVRAARRMLERLEKFNADKPENKQIQIRVGINTGDVSTGGTLGEKLMVMGDAVNVAARLQEAAQPGTVVIGERTARAIRGRFELNVTEALDLKGKSLPVGAHVLGDEIVGEVPREFVAPLVGRAAELTTLHDILERVVREGRPALVTIVGDPGVGKSRLVDEFVASIEEGATLVGRCLPYGDGVTLWPFQEMLRAAAKIFGTDLPQVAVEKVLGLARSLPAALGADPERVAGGFAATMGLEEALGPLSKLEPREISREVVHAWQLFLTSMATSGPVIVVVEDLYWADDATLNLLKQLSEHCAGAIVFLCPTRPELMSVQSQWVAGLKSYASLTLDPLDLQDSAELVSHLLNLEPPIEGAIGQMLEKAEGNPFFLEEIIQRLADQGHLSRGDGGWMLHGDLSGFKIPDNIHSVVLSRIDLLSPKDKQVIQAASVVGRSFWPGAVAHIATLPGVEESFDSLLRRQLITEKLVSAVPDEAEYSFRHVLIRDVAYESLPRTDRGRAHAALAEWIERTRGDRAIEVAELLAHHHGRAYELLGDGHSRVLARENSLIAAESAARRFAIARASKLGSRAVTLSTDGHERIEALEALGDLHVLTGEGDAAWSSYNDAIAELQRLDPHDERDLARVASKAAILATRWEPTMETPPSDEEVDRVIEMGLKAAGHTDSRERALLLAIESLLARFASEETETPESLARESLRIAQQLDDPELLSLATDSLAIALLPKLRFAEVARLEQERVELIPQLSDAKEIRDIYGTNAWAALFVGRYGEADSYGTLAAERANGIDAGDYLHALSWRTQARFMAGDWHGALEDVHEVERLERERQGAESSLALRAFGVAALCHELRGETGKAGSYVDVLEKHRQKFAGAGRLSFAGLYALPARALVRRKEPEAARQWLILERSPYLGLNLEAACEVVPALEDWALAEEVIALAKREIPDQEETSLNHFINRLEGRMAAEKGDHAAAASLLRRSADGFARLGAPWEEAWSRLLLAEAQARAGSRDEASSSLGAALPVFRQLGSVIELQRAEELGSTLS